jgi:hypothetical protein
MPNANLPPEFEQRAAQEQGSKIPDEPPQQGSARPDFAHESIIERAAQRLDWTIAPEILHPTPRSLDDVVNQVVNERSPPSPTHVSRSSRLRFGHRAGATRLRPIARLCLAAVLIAAPAGAGIFLLTHPAAEKDAAESTPAKEAPVKTGEGTPSTGGPAVMPPAPSAVQSAAQAGPAPVGASAPPTPESEGNLPLGAPLSIAPTGEPRPNTIAKTDVSTPSEATSTAAAPPLTKPGFSAAETATLVARGDALFGTGDVASARLFYERVADAGEAQAAVRLAETFDPVFLNQAHLRSVPGDSGMALLWYRRARDLGAREVERELKRLERNGEGSDP